MQCFLDWTADGAVDAFIEQPQLGSSCIYIQTHKKDTLNADLLLKVKC